MLVRVGVRDQLPGRIRLRASEQQEAGAADAHQKILQGRGPFAIHLQPAANRSLVALRLGQVVTKNRCQLRVARRLRGAS